MLYTIFRSKKSTAAKVLLFLWCLALIGCDDGNKDKNKPGLPIGNWISAYDEEFSITASTFTSGFGGEMTYGGDIVYIRQDGNGAGYITIQYTAKNNFDGTPDAAAIGKYYVIHWRNMRGSSVELAGAAKVPDYGDGKVTQHDAEAEYTVGNGYFAIYSACRKQ